MRDSFSGMARAKLVIMPSPSWERAVAESHLERMGEGASRPLNRPDVVHPFQVGWRGCTQSLKASKPFQAGSGGSTPACGAYMDGPVICMFGM